MATAHDLQSNAPTPTVSHSPRPTRWVRAARRRLLLTKWPKCTAQDRYSVAALQQALSRRSAHSEVAMPSGRFWFLCGALLTSAVSLLHIAIIIGGPS